MQYHKSDIKTMPEYFDRYINLVEDIDVISALENGIPFLKSEISNLEKMDNLVYAPGKWTVKDILQHIIDNERIFCYRAMRFARKDETPLPGVDENYHAANAHANERSLEDLVNEFNYTRQSTIALFKSFTEDMLMSEGIGFNKKTSVLAIGFLLSGHLIHHFNVIRERYYPLLIS